MILKKLGFGFRHPIPRSIPDSEADCTVSSWILGDREREAIMILALLLLYSVAVVTNADSCNSGDIIFLLDNSGSIGDTNFKTMLTFVSDIVNSFDIGPDRVQIGLTTFESAVRSEFQLNTHRTKKQVTDALQHIPFIGGGTNTGEALKYVRQNGFSKENGHREGFAKVVIVVTDGLSADQNLTRAEAKLAHQDGIKLFAIGVGQDYKLEELRDIASDPDEKYVFTVKEFVGLKWIESTLKAGICKTGTPDCVSSAADVVFLLDSSGSVGAHNFSKMINFTKDVIGKLPIGKNGIRIGVDIFHTPVSHAFDLDRFFNANDMKAHLDTLTYSGGETETGKALRFLREDSFTAKSGARDGNNIAKVAIILTDGRSNDHDETLQEAKALKASNGGVEVVAIGIGSEIDFEEIQAMSSDINKNALRIENFEKLDHLEPLITNRLCPHKPISCMAQSDVVFLVDGSCSVGKENFDKSKHFVTDVISQLYVHQTGAQVGVEAFSCQSRNTFSLNTFTDRVKLQHAVNQMDFGTGGGTDTGEALKQLWTKSFHSSNGARENARKVGVIITDGDSKSKARTFYQAHKAREAGIRLVTVGVGKEFMDELTGIANSPDTLSSKYLFTVDDYDSLRTVTSNVTDILCKLEQSPSW